uniref:MetA-pathway of phenol degradation n=1 Tax=Candidatus Kentrum sp. DK TaxID=2126562 RepID=A0A450T445_9GAMM|nr:MAG: hypothetical protein BECKDK2373C_GA0170839_10798 [Candidatus Kentron sp. DK]VFJ61357.1 MAG: hypothetical protein BECKDK2373B_GA0170837_110013 [Candidatus Kentron sp. DK]
MSILKTTSLCIPCAIALLASAPVSADDISEQPITRRGLAHLIDSGLILPSGSRQVDFAYHSDLTQSPSWSSASTGFGTSLRMGLSDDTEIQAALSTGRQRTQSGVSTVSDARSRSVRLSMRHRLLAESSYPGWVASAHMAHHHVSGGTGGDWSGGIGVEAYKTSDPVLLRGKLALDRAPFNTGLSATGEVGMLFLVNNRLSLDFSTGCRDCLGLSRGGGIRTGKVAVNYRTGKNSHVGASWSSARWGNESSGGVGVHVSHGF